jgi:cytochrome c2
MNFKEWLLVFTAIVVSVSPATAGDATLGQKVFNKCKACHEAAEPKNRVGPSLRGPFTQCHVLVFNLSIPSMSIIAFS